MAGAPATARKAPPSAQETPAADAKPPAAEPRPPAAEQKKGLSEDTIVQRATAARDSWWAYRELRKPAAPEVRDAAWCRNEIDRFILARIEQKGLRPAGEADREALIRRASFDLTGLPPSPEEVASFVADRSPDAYERLVDRLLASPHYGEKWARHWLDLVRYADTNGFERDSDKTAAWKYRDFVVRALNDDMPYQRFVKAHVAGDELADRDFDTLVATGFFRLGLWDDEVPDLAQALADLPAQIQSILDRAPEIEGLAEEFKRASNFLYLGRGYNFPAALEGALKLKEISYIHAEGYPAAEMKHGPIALIDEMMPVVCIAPHDAVFDKITSNIQEVKARKGKIIAITTRDEPALAGKLDYEFRIPETVDLLAPILASVPLQLLAYYIAVKRGCNVDQPRNLAKSVTVE